VGMPYARFAYLLGPLLLNAMKIPTIASTTNATITIVKSMTVLKFAAEEACRLTLVDVADVLIEVGLVLDTLVDVRIDCVLEDDVVDESPNS